MDIVRDRMGSFNRRNSIQIAVRQTLPEHIHRVICRHGLANRFCLGTTDTECHLSRTAIPGDRRSLVYSRSHLLRLARIPLPPCNMACVCISRIDYALFCGFEFVAVKLNKLPGFGGGLSASCEYWKTDHCRS